jgi:hypothetical protein
LYAGAGVLTGLGILNRPNSAVLIIPLMLLALIGRAAIRQRVLGAGLLLLTAVLVTVPWLVRDATVMGQFVPLTTQSGVVAAGTYNSASANDTSNPASWRPPTKALVPEYAGFLRGTELDEEHLLDTAAKNYASAHPAYPLRVAFWNTARLFELTGPSVSQGSWRALDYGPLPSDAAFASFVLVGLLAVAGVCTRAARSAPWPVWLAPLLLVGSTVFLLGESRLRTTIDPFVLCLASLAVAAVLQRLSAWRARAPVVATPSKRAETPVAVS